MFGGVVIGFFLSSVISFYKFSLRFGLRIRCVGFGDSLYFVGGVSISILNGFVLFKFREWAFSIGIVIYRLILLLFANWLFSFGSTFCFIVYVLVLFPFVWLLFSFFIRWPRWAVYGCGFFSLWRVVSLVSGQ